MKDRWHRSHEWIQLLLDNPDMDPEEYKKELDRMQEESERWSKKMVGLVLALTAVLVLAMAAIRHLYGSNSTVNNVWLAIALAVLLLGFALNLWADNERDPHLNSVAHTIILSGGLLLAAANLFLR